MGDVTHLHQSLECFITAILGSVKLKHVGTISQKINMIKTFGSVAFCHVPMQFFLEPSRNFLDGFHPFLLFVEMHCTFQLLYNTNQALLRLSSLSCSSSLFSHILLSHLWTKAPSQSLIKICAPGGSKLWNTKACQVLCLKRQDSA